MNQRRIIPLVLLSLGSGPAWAINVPLRVQETAGVPRDREPVTSGVPVPRGENLMSTAGLGIDGGAVPAQFRVLSRWDGAPDDASKPVKWLLVDFQATVAANGVAAYALGAGPGNASGPDIASMSGDGDTVTVDTGVLKFTIKRNGFNIIDEAWYDPAGVFADGTRIIASSPNTGGFVREQSGTTYSTHGSAPVNGQVSFRSGQSSRVYTRPDLGFVIEENGPLRAVIKVKARHRNGASESLGFETRIHAYKGKSFVKIDHAYYNGMCSSSFQNSFTNPADDVDYRGGSVWMNFRLALSGPKTFVMGREGETHVSGNLAGGQSVWLNADDADDGRGLGHTLNNQGDVSGGGRAEGWADLSDGQRGMAIIDRWFWQKYEKRLTVGDDGGVRLDLSRNDKLWEAQGLRDQVTLHFHGAGVTGEDLKPTVFGFAKNPLFARASSEWYRQSGAFLPLSPHSPGCGIDDLACLMDGNLEANFARALAVRESALIYGGLNFGGFLDQSDGLGSGSRDLSGDHGANYYDGLYIIAHNFVRKADVESGGSKALDWLGLLTEAARHTLETEAYHVYPGLGYREDINGLMPAYGQAYRSGTHVEHNFGSGFFYYYYLTGDERARGVAIDGAVSLYVNNWMDAPGAYEPGAIMDPGRLSGQTQDWFAHAYELTRDSFFRTRLETAVDRTVQEFNRRLVSPEKFRASGMRQVIGLQLPALYRAWAATGKTRADWAAAVAGVSDFNMREDRNPSTGLIEADGRYGNFLSYDGYANQQCTLSWFLNGASNNKNAEVSNGYYACYPVTNMELMGGMWVAYAMTGEARYADFLRERDFYLNRLRAASSDHGYGFGRPAQSLRNSMHLNAMMLMDIRDDRPPVLAAVAAGPVTSIGARIAWTTDEPADAQVDYGPTAAYGSVTPPADASPRATSHAVDVAGLTGDTVYHFRVRSKDGMGNLSLSPDMMFTTRPPDATPPTAPGNVAAVALSDTRVRISWDAAADPDTGILGYEVYRDGTRVLERTTALTFTDTGLAEATSYLYAVKAVNGQQLETLSPAVTAATLPDGTPPAVSAVVPVDPTTLVVSFTEPMETSSAQNAANYAVTGGPAVLAALLSADRRAVTLTTSRHDETRVHVLSIRNLRDRSSTPNGLPPYSGSYHFFIEATLQEGTGAPDLGVDLYDGTDDAALKGDEPDRNQGAIETLQLFEGLNRRPIVRFALPDLSRWTLISARLDLYSLPQAYPQSGDVALYALAQDWTEDQVTYNSPWTAPGGIWDTTTDFGAGAPGVAARASIAYDTWLEFDVTRLVRAWLDGALPNHGVIVRGVNALFPSAEHTPLLRRPKLFLSLVKKPDPAAPLPVRPRRLRIR